MSEEDAFSSMSVDTYRVKPVMSGHSDQRTTCNDRTVTMGGLNVNIQVYSCIASTLFGGSSHLLADKTDFIVMNYAF